MLNLRTHLLNLRKVPLCSFGNNDLALSLAFNDISFLDILYLLYLNIQLTL